MSDETVYTVTESEYAAHTDAYDGICLECGEWTTGGVEPDAEGYECENCGAHAVMGAENALLCGRITFAEE